MSISEKIQPIKKSHSIREAVISVFLQNPIIKPERFQSLIDGEFKDIFQQFDPLSQVKVQIKSEKGEFEKPIQQILNNAGFKFIAFEKGAVSKVLQGLNEEKRTFISFHNLNYTNWKTYYEEYIKVVEIIAKQHADFFVNGFSLHYLDEFLWIDETESLDLKTFFNEENDYLPKEFFNSKNTTYNLTTERIIDGVKIFDRIEIIIDVSVRPSVTISHNIFRPLEKIIELKELIIEKKFEEILNSLHLHNKTILGNLLKKDVKDLIKLTNV